MILPTTLQDRIVDLLRSIPELVSEIGDLGSIQAYDDESLIDGDAATTAAGLMGKALLVVWMGTESPRTGELRGWRHKFTIIIEAPDITTHHRIAQLIIDGVPQPPAGDGVCSFLNSEIPDTDGIQEVVIEPEPAQDGTTRLTISFSVTER